MVLKLKKWKTIWYWTKIGWKYPIFCNNLYAIFFENVGQLSRSFFRMTGCKILRYHAGWECSRRCISSCWMICWIWKCIEYLVWIQTELEHVFLCPGPPYTAVSFWDECLFCNPTHNIVSCTYSCHDCTHEQWRDWDELFVH
jgi:hypothetical protein